MRISFTFELPITSLPAILELVKVRSDFNLYMPQEERIALLCGRVDVDAKHWQSENTGKNKYSLHVLTGGRSASAMRQQTVIMLMQELK